MEFEIAKRRFSFLLTVHIMRNAGSLPPTSTLLHNMEEGRELLDGFYNIEERRKQYETKWREVEPILVPIMRKHSNSSLLTR